ncbi:MAG: DUF1566 domain-containing protein [Treponema sp.]|jgi:hypothetical protein|nr:DUF1566 domain-containing protein [Treponema sp.]
MKTRMTTLFVRLAAGAVILAGCANPEDGGGDVTAPVLSAGLVTNTASKDGTTATVKFTSTGAGTCYIVVYPAAEDAPESGAQIESGYGLADIRDTSAAGSDSNAVCLSGLIRGTPYRAHVTVKDRAGIYSAVWSSDEFTPVSGSMDIASADGTAAVVNFTPEEAGACYVAVYLSGAAAPADGAAVEAVCIGGDTGDVKVYTENAEANVPVSVDISGLTAFSAYKAYVTVKNEAGSYSFTPLDYYGPGGGLIFYVSTSGFGGCHYLEAAPADLPGTYQWGGYGTSCDTGTAIGTGAANTAALAACEHGTPSYGSGLHEAARACAAYDGGGCDDWFLPGKEELNLMYTNLKQQGLGGFSRRSYWSSSEIAGNSAWYQSFASGSQDYYSKDSDCSVRAVRAF